MMTNSIAEIEKASHIVLIASDPYKRQPILNLRIKKALTKGAKIYIVNTAETELDRFATLKIRIPEHGAGDAAKILLKQAFEHDGVNIEDRVELQEARMRHNDKINSILAAENAFGTTVVAELEQLTNEIVGAKGAIILYDEMATLE